MDGLEGPSDGAELGNRLGRLEGSNLEGSDEGDWLGLKLRDGSDEGWSLGLVLGKVEGESLGALELDGRLEGD